MKFGLFFTVLLLSGSLYAQTFNKIFSYTSGSNTNEYSFAAIESGNGNYLIGVGNRLLCLSVNGDSLWSKTYSGFGEITKLFRDHSSQLYAATTKGKMLFLKINESNGDTISSIKVPAQYSNSGYTIYDALFLPDGDIIYSYNNGGSYGGVLRRFTPGATTNKWANDYAGENWGPKSILLDDTCVVVAGYRGVANYRVNLYIRKISINNATQWSAEYYRNTSYADRLIGIQKNTTGNYLVATSFNFNDVLTPSIAIVSNAGDSVAVNHLSMLDGKNINHGYLTSLQPSGTNGFYAAGYLNIDQLSPDNTETGMGFMTAFSVDNNGMINSAYNYSSVGFYQAYSGAPYSGSEAWGNGCFKTKDGYYLLYGVGNRIYDPATGANVQAQWRSFVVKSDQFLSSVNETASNLHTFSLYPNPVSQSMIISSAGAADLLYIKIYNSIGNMVYEKSNLRQQQLHVSVQSFSPGVYFIQLGSDSNTSTLKFIKE